MTTRRSSVRDVNVWMKKADDLLSSITNLVSRNDPTIPMNAYPQYVDEISSGVAELGFRDVIHFCESFPAKFNIDTVTGLITLPPRDTISPLLPVVIPEKKKTKKTISKPKPERKIKSSSFMQKKPKVNVDDDTVALLANYNPVPPSLRVSMKKEDLAVFEHPIRKTECVHFKFAHEGKTRRFAFPPADHSLLVGALKGRVQDVTGTKGEVLLYWRDDESLIILECGEDIQAAIDFAESQNKPPTTIVIEADFEKEEEKKEEIAETRDEATKETEEKKEDEVTPPRIVSRDESRVAFNGFAFMCDSCDVYLAPSNGGRYKCLICYNFDLCAGCVAKGVHENHALVRLFNSATTVPLADENGGTENAQLRKTRRCTPVFIARNVEQPVVAKPIVELMGKQLKENLAKERAKLEKAMKDPKSPVTISEQKVNDLYNAILKAHEDVEERMAQTEPLLAQESEPERIEDDASSSDDDNIPWSQRMKNEPMKENAEEKPKMLDADGKEINFLQQIKDDFMKYKLEAKPKILEVVLSSDDEDEIPWSQRMKNDPISKEREERQKELEEFFRRLKIVNKPNMEESSTEGMPDLLADDFSDVLDDEQKTKRIKGFFYGKKDEVIERLTKTEESSAEKKSAEEIEYHQFMSPHDRVRMEHEDREAWRLIEEVEAMRKLELSRIEAEKRMEAEREKKKLEEKLDEETKQIKTIDAERKKLRDEKRNKENNGWIEKEDEDEIVNPILSELFMLLQEEEKIIAEDGLSDLSDLFEHESLVSLESDMEEMSKAELDQAESDHDDVPLATATAVNLAPIDMEAVHRVASGSTQHRVWPSERWRSMGNPGVVTKKFVRDRDEFLARSQEMYMLPMQLEAILLSEMQEGYSQEQFPTRLEQLHSIVVKHVGVSNRPQHRTIFTCNVDVENEMIRLIAVDLANRLNMMKESVGFALPSLRRKIITGRISELDILIAADEQSYYRHAAIQLRPILCDDPFEGAIEPCDELDIALELVQEMESSPNEATRVTAPVTYPTPAMTISSAVGDATAPAAVVHAAVWAAVEEHLRIMGAGAPVAPTAAAEAAVRAAVEEHLDMMSAAPAASIPAAADEPTELSEAPRVMPSHVRKDSSDGSDIEIIDMLMEENDSMVGSVEMLESKFSSLELKPAAAATVAAASSAQSVYATPAASPPADAATPAAAPTALAADLSDEELIDFLHDADRSSSDDKKEEAFPSDEWKGPEQEEVEAELQNFIVESRSELVRNIPAFMEYSILLELHGLVEVEIPFRLEQYCAQVRKHAKNLKEHKTIISQNKDEDKELVKRIAIDLGKRLQNMRQIVDYAMLCNRKGMILNRICELRVQMKEFKYDQLWFETTCRDLHTLLLTDEYTVSYNPMKSIEQGWKFVFDHANGFVQQAKANAPKLGDFLLPQSQSTNNSESSSSAQSTSQIPEMDEIRPSTIFYTPYSTQTTPDSSDNTTNSVKWNPWEDEQFPAQPIPSMKNAPVVEAAEASAPPLPGYEPVYQPHVELTEAQQILLSELFETGIFHDYDRMVEAARIANNLEQAIELMLVDDKE